MTTVTFELASRFARLTLGHLEQQYPYKMDHVLGGPEDARPPIHFHPIFHGSFDWHSCVHGWWQVMTLLRRHPRLPEASAIRAKADRMLTAEKAAGELAYLSRPYATGFERPYGWGWLLSLHGELARHEAPWATALEPLARAFAARFRDYLPRLTYPIRVGTHFNTSFALIHARGWALEHEPELAALIDARARDWFGQDRDCQAWEPGGDEFLSSALTEALLMSRVLPSSEFAAWFDAFLPRAAQGEPATLFNPATVSDRSDGKIAHLDGVNLSRAWCWRALAKALDRPALAEAADVHIAASLGHIDDHYMGTHWLASFALLALLEAG
ncbi:DUF2891 domain-containing protein [Sphingomonas sp. LB-2]|uniref:DUF2891 domain-containing protein n=1 Tax=Sphingomonas caeni TaxID=2984949 RepID=UPI002230CF00|nr:DUF2891 domain-containing protein [Sphingomonas caeni]MCW3847698.1 DUF2891 domain-containing protein [Sphingomonas caeni]